jgi:hypothetical protein
MTSEGGSFARYTTIERKPQILRQVNQSHDYPPDIREEILAFEAEIRASLSNSTEAVSPDSRGAAIRPLREEAPDVAFWNKALSTFQGRTWLQVPWLFAETLFYRRLLEIVRFHQPGPWQYVDPFASQKEEELEDALSVLLPILSREFPDPRTEFVHMMHDALWGNRADLSNPEVASSASEGLLDLQSHQLLIDDTATIWDHLSRSSPARVDIITDNAGIELALDLRLADAFLAQGVPVRMHLKQTPFFVSDARICDLYHTLGRLASASPRSASLAQRLHEAIAEERITLRDDPFWTTYLTYHQLPAHIRQELSESGLVLLKGDLNYRRLLDDRHWPTTAHLSDIMTDFPAPLATLRTLKAEVIVDLEPGQADALTAADPAWMINGKRGVIQFIVPKHLR